MNMSTNNTRKEPISKLGIGPMSQEIVEAVFRFSQERDIPLMLIASKNQIDHSGGYVNGWNTKQYMEYVKKMKAQYPKATVYVCRDHCGPGFNGLYDLKDVYKTIDADIENGFDLIHVDFCHYPGPEEEMLAESKKAIDYIRSKAPKMLLEIGTDENTGKDFEDLGRVERHMKFFTKIVKPEFFVCQTGTVIKEMNQRGAFREQYVRRLKTLADRYGLHIKEHNADYLAADEIKRRQGLIGAVNVAPQYGVMQTMMTIEKALRYGFEITDFVETAYTSTKWRKWLDQNSHENKLHCAVVAGHYVFNSPAYKKLFDNIMRHENLREAIIEGMMKQFDLYITNLT